MLRPRAKQRKAVPDKAWRYLIVDGYVDEPAALGVPPFISPHVRSLAGGLLEGGAAESEVGYITVDQWRDMRGQGLTSAPLTGLEFVILVAGCVVPGKYLRGTPVSPREARELSVYFDGVPMVVSGSAARSCLVPGSPSVTGDPGPLGESISSEGRAVSRDRTSEEWDLHLERGAFVIMSHPDFPTPLIAELETTSGCPRFISGGCSFCMEPRKGALRSRSPEALKREVELLAGRGLENVRVGGQSDLISYGSDEIGRSEVPRPDPERVRSLMSGIKGALYAGRGLDDAIAKGRRPGIDCGIVHTDNANPAVMADHPELSEEALTAIVENTTSGSVLAFGLESADPEVREANNLNSTPEQALKAIEMTAKVGGRYGKNGMPALLPGINFLGGLHGQTASSFELDKSFLEEVLKRGLPIRRINIRWARFGDGEALKERARPAPGVEKAFNEFRRRVREELDRTFLSKLLPIGHVLRGVHMEASAGRTHFGRQIGSYPVLVGVEHSADTGRFMDVAVSGISARSVTGFMTPFPLRSSSFRDLQAVPGIGRKRAASFFRSPPRDRLELTERIGNENRWVVDHISLEEGDGPS